MLRTRRFKALNGSGKNLRIVDKIAIYDNNGKQIDCCVIQKDDEGREFYCPSNPNDKHGSFTDRLEDAIEFIKNGFGDEFQQIHLFGFLLHDVVRYIDREYGESIRKNTIEGWKDVKFSYGVKFCFLESFSAGKLICKNEKLMGYDDTINDILTFETEKEASDFIEKVNKKVEEYYKEYSNLERTCDIKWDYENIIKPFFNKIKGNIGSDSVYWMAFRGINKEEQKLKPEYKMKVVRVVIN